MNGFNDLINGEHPVLVDFYAVWCGPCKAMEPALLEAARDLDGKVKVVKVDIDKNPGAAQVYNVQGVPTLMLFKKGDVVWRQSGALPANVILESVRKHI